MSSLIYIDETNKEHKAENNFAININTPIGTCLIYQLGDIPENWVECDGRSLSIEDYKDLYIILGKAFGYNEQNQTFNIPNLNGKTLVGLDINDIDFNSLGKTGGEKEHTLNSNEIPKHKHNISELTVTAQSAGSHRHSYVDYYVGTSGNGRDTSGGGCASSTLTSTNRSTTQATISHTHTYTLNKSNTGNKGNSLAHNNIQPSFVCRFIIKIK